MNDFTKEELQDILSYIRAFMGNGYDHPHDHKGYALMRKVRGMINAQCEHKETNYDDGLYYCDDCGIFVK